MRTAPKVTLIVGAVLLIGSIIAMIAGFGSIDLDSPEEQIFTGDAPTEWEVELNYSSIYFVYVEEGSNVSVEAYPVEGNSYNRFIPCSEDFSCEEHNTRVGYTYIGDLSVENNGVYQVEFTGEGEVLVTELEIR